MASMPPIRDTVIGGEGFTGLTEDSMKAIGIVSAIVLFLSGFGVGFVVRDFGSSPPAIDAAQRSASGGTEDLEPNETQRRSTGRWRSARDDDRRSHDRRNREDGNEAEGRRVSRDDAMARVLEASAAGNIGQMERALEQLIRSEGDPLGDEQLEQLGALLSDAEPHILEQLATALAVSGGEKGVAMVIAFAGDSDADLHSRERALHGLGRVPPEQADVVYPALADFLESGAAPRLQHTAARAIGELFGEDGVSTLLALKAERPGISTGLIFDALGSVGKLKDTDLLLEMLAGDVTRRERRELMNAVGRISVRHQNGELLLEMMRDPPPGVSRSSIAGAIEGASHELDTGFLRSALIEASGDAEAQERIARALAENGGRQGLDALFDVASLEGYQMNPEALANALGHSRNSEAVPEMMELIRKHQDEGILEPLARGIFRHGQPGDVDQLMGLLESGSDSQRRAIAHGLGEADLGSLDMDRIVSALRRESSPEIGAQLAHSLQRAYGERGLQEVSGILFDTSTEPDLRRGLLWGLGESWERGETGTRDIILRVASNDPSHDMRREAISMMEHGSDATMVPELQRLLSREQHPDVQRRLREVIEEIGERR